MSKIIAITNQKGGVGKTTSTVNLGASLALLDQKVLLIDIDPQGNATSGVGINKGDVDKCVYNLLVEDHPAKDVIVKTEVENFIYNSSNNSISRSRNRISTYYLTRS